MASWISKGAYACEAWACPQRPQQSIAGEVHGDGLPQNAKATHWHGWRACGGHDHGIAMAWPRGEENRGDSLAAGSCTRGGGVLYGGSGRRARVDTGAGACVGQVENAVVVAWPRHAHVFQVAGFALDAAVAWPRRAGARSRAPRGLDGVSYG
jgi:hypothetical protein